MLSCTYSSRIKILVLFLCFFLLHAVSWGQSRIYVHQYATGQNNGTSWQDAFTDLQDALAASIAGDEIWVAEGIYHPTSTTDRAIYFSLKSGVQLFGGFAGTESNVQNRDIVGHPVFIDGDIGAPGDSLDNSYNLLYLFHPDSTTLIDGFTFRYGQADKELGGTGTLSTSGSAIFINGLNAFAYPTIRNCTFKNNYSKYEGGAVCMVGGNNGDIGAIVENCIFYKNNCSRRGGAWFESGSSSHFYSRGFYHCTFIDNYAHSAGGALSTVGSSKGYYLNIFSCTFNNNNIFNIGLNSGELRPKTISTASLFEKTGFIKIDSCSFSEDIQHYLCIIGSDQTEYHTGRVQFSIKNSLFDITPKLPQYSSSVFYFNSDFESLKVPVNIIDNCEFRVGTICGVGFGDAERLQVTNTRFIEKKDSSGIRLYASDELVVKNCTYQQYVSNDSSSETYYFNKLLILSAQKVHVESSTILKNELTFSCDTLEITNSIILSDSILADLSPPYFYYYNPPDVINLQSNIFSTAIIPDAPELTVFNTQWATDPLLINPESGDMRLQSCSPAINAGDNSLTTTLTDIAGNPRVMFNTVDIGAYEAGALTPLSAVDVLTTADCAGENQPTGTILVSDPDGCTPFTYSWTGNLPGTSNQSGLNAGTYTVTISDSKGRTLEQTIIVSEKPSPQVVAQTTPVICGTTTGGTAMLDGANGTAPFSFDWGNGVIDSMVTGLAYGIYPVTITDANGCTASANIQIARMGNLQVQIIKNNISCHDETDGSITIQPTNGAPPYEWLWQFNGSTAPDISNLAAGNYAGTMTDNLGCAINWIVPIENPDTIAANTEVTAATGPAVADGSILLVPSGGTGDFTATWDNGATGLFINNLLPGFYIATITDDNGCTQTVTVEVPWSSGTDEVTVGLVRVWPNPAKEWVTVQPQAIMLPFRLILTDAVGRVVREVIREEDGTFLVPVRELPEGVYRWEINNGRLRMGGKLMHF